MSFRSELSLEAIASDTWRVMTSPTAFFKEMPEEPRAHRVGTGFLCALVAGCLMPVYTYVLVLQLAAALEGFLPGVGVTPSDVIPWLTAQARATMFVSIASAPMTAMLMMTSTAFAIHVSGVIFAPATISWQKALDVTAYCFYPMALTVIPGLGHLIMYLWLPLTFTYAVMHAFKVSMMRATLLLTAAGLFVVMVMGGWEFVIGHLAEQTVPENLRKPPDMAALLAELQY
jgi:hypothetical protein